MPRKQHAYHYIYKITCKITNKFYVGMHSTSNLEDNYMGSGKRIRYSIRKYGIENHEKEILEFLTDRNTLKLRESEIVNEMLLKDPLCVNLVLGGAGDVYGRKLKPRQYKPLTESHKANLSKTAKGKNGKFVRTDETKEKIRQANIGKTQSSETKEKRGESIKKFWEDNPDAKIRKIESAKEGWRKRKEQMLIKKTNNEIL